MWNEDDYNELSKNQPEYHYFRYKYWAKQRKKEFDLDIAWFVKTIKMPCFYCGSRSGEFRGIDRINNKQGYVVENCVPCCKICNRAKWTSSMENFINWAKNIANNFPED